MFKKLFYCILVVSLLASFLVGCKAPEAQPTQPPAEPSATVEKAAPTTAPTAEPTKAPEKPAGVHLTLAHVQGEWIWPVLEELGKMYTEKTGNTVEWIYVPADGWAEWTQAQFVAGTEPDIFWGLPGPSDAFKNGQIIDLQPYYDKVSPYTGAPWRASFLDGLLEGVVDKYSGKGMYGVPLLQVTVNLYYNKAIFAEAGLPNQAPQTWGGVVNACEKVQALGKDYTPFAVMNSMDWNLWWFRGSFMEDLFVNSDVVSKLDIITPNGKLELPEIVLGVKTGVIDPADPRYVDYFKFMKSFSKCFNKGFNVVSWEYEKLFFEGKAAMWLDGSWFPNQVLTTKSTLDYGIGPVPYVDSGISQYARNQLMKYSIGAGNPDLTVTAKAQKKLALTLPLIFSSSSQTLLPARNSSLKTPCSCRW